jgi:hypothetical protein
MARIVRVTVRLNLLADRPLLLKMYRQRIARVTTGNEGGLG